MTIFEDTRDALREALDANPLGLSPYDVRWEVGNRGGDPGYLHYAAKLLRDSGYPVCCDRRRNLSRWYKATTAAEQREYQRRVNDDAYSELRSVARASARLTGT